MAYNDDSVLARLSSLNESHDSIATAAQWIMFHRRHADRTVQLWMQRLKDSSSTKRLSLVYLANEVVQQSRIRHKEDFVIAFSPVIAESCSIAYKGAPAEIQAKLRRVVDVWKDRTIFEAPIQNAIFSRLDELDKARGAPKTSFSGSPFSSTSIPAEFAPLVASHQSVTKLGTNLEATVSSADEEYDKQMDPDVAVPSAPVYAARLNGLLKTLATAENAVAERVKARESLVTGLEKLLEANRSALLRDKDASQRISTRKTEIEDKKQEVEVAIMRALGPADGNDPGAGGDSVSPHPELDRPEVEALTPPAMDDDELADVPQEEPLQPASAGVAELSDNLDSKEHHAHQSLAISANGSNKRRRLDESDDTNHLDVDEDLDPEVAEMLKNENGEIL